MAVKDAIVLNTTGSNFQAVQSGDTVRIKGDSTELLSIENSSETRVFSVGTSTTSVNIEGNVTSSKPISGSSTSTASFGHFVADTYEGDAREIAATLPRTGDIVSGSSQIAADVSGSFISGFNFGATADELYVGVSGSNSEHSASVSGSTRAMAASGSDLTHLKSDEIGHIRGIVGAGTFTAGDALGTGRGYLLGAGSQNAALAFGGYGPSNTRNKTEHYNGTSWSEGGNLNQNHHNGQMGAGWGVEYAAIKTGGNGPGLNTSTEVYNGTSWSEIQNKTVGQCCGGGAGTQNAGVAFGGQSPATTCTEHWNGTSWSTGGTMITGGGRMNCGAGLENAALAAGIGPSPTPNTCTEEYNGTSWSAGGILSDKKSRAGTAGTQNAAIAIDGSGGSSDDVSLHYDGASWSTGGSSLHNKFDVAAVGLQSAALKFGGTFFQTCTEQYNANYTNTGSFGRIEAGYVLGNAEDIKGQIPRDAGLVTSSAQLAADISGSFISGFNYGITTDQFFVGVSGSSAVTAHSASVSGSSSSLEASGSDFDIFGSAQIRGNVGSGVWSAGGTMITARYRAYKGGTGLENAAIVVGSGPSEYSNDGPTEKYDGTSWSADGSGLNTTLRFYSLTGTQNAALSVGGLQTWTSKKNVEIYNGNVWTATQDLPETSGSHIVFGTVNAASAVGMMTQDSANNTYVYNFNGTSWSTPSVNVEVSVAGPGITGTHDGMAGGSQNAGISAAGYAAGTGVLNKAFTFDGTTFTQVGNLNTARTGVGGWGTANTALVVGGVSPGATSKTELWDGVAWTETTDAANSGGRGGGSAGAFAEAGISTPGLGYTEHWSGNFTNTGSFGYVKAGFLKGDAGNIGASLASGSNVVSGSFQLAVDISGSFDEGFNFGGTVESRFDGVSGSRFTPGVSGSEQFYSASFGHPSEFGDVSGSHPSGGADYSHLLDYEAGHIRGQVVDGVWSTGGSLITARKIAQLMTGTQNAALAGDVRGAPNAKAEEYNGNTWAAAPDMIQARGGGAAAGTQNASFFAGGTTPGTYAVPTEDYNGVSFSNIASSNLNTGRQKIAGAGSQNSGLVFGGTPSAPKQQTEEWNGTAWSEAGSSAYLTNGGYSIAGTGVQNAALAVSGQPSSDRKNGTEHYDGTSWRVGGNLNTTLGHQRTAAGTENASWAAFGQAPAFSVHSEVYDGAVWSTTANAITNRGNAGGAGTGAVGLAAGGYSPGQLDSTVHWDGGFQNTGSFGRIESDYFTGDATSISSTIFSETNTGAVTSSAQIASDVSGSFISGFNFGGLTSSFYTGVSGSANHLSGSVGSSPLGSDFTHLLQTDIGHIRGCVVGGSWSVGGSLGTGVGYIAQFGVQNASIVAGGGITTPGTVTGKTQFYNGTAWSELCDLNTARGSLKGAGIANAGVVFGGYNNCDDTEEWNGSTWSNSSDMINGRHNPGHFGTQNAAVAVGGGSGTDTTQHYDGSNWTAGGTLIRDAWNVGSAGLEDSGLIFGTGDGTALGTCTDEYDGTTWTAGGALNRPMHAGAGAGIQNAAWSFHCSPNANPGSATTEFYDGTSWSIGPNANTARFSAGGSGTTAAGLLAGGNISPFAPANYFTCTEEFTGQYNNTGSFGNVTASFITGDGSGLASTLSRSSDIISGSAQIADDVSGSFVSGFNFGDSVNRSFDGVSGSRFTPGVSGSSEFYSSSFGHPSQFGGVSGSHPSGGTDFSPLLQYAAGHIKGTVISGAWTVVGSMITGRRKLSASGVTNATLAIGGCVPSNQFTSCTEEYNGSSWSAAGALITGRKAAGSTSPGTQNAALSVAGNAPSTYGNTCTEHYNGTAWAAGGAVIQRRFDTGNAGTENAALLFGGRTYTPSLTAQTCTEEYNGTAWSESGASGPAFAQFAGGGLQNAAFSFGGTDHDQYDGTTWSEETSLLIAKDQGAAAGTQNSILTIGGLGSPHPLSLHYDGTTWSNGGSLNAYKYGNAGTGLQSSAMHMGGEPGYSTTVEEYNGNYSNTGSFGRAEATYIEGDATEISSSLATAYSIKTSSSEMETDISGSFRDGIELKGAIVSQPIGAWRQVQNSNIPRGMHALIGNKDSAIALGDGGYSPAPAAVAMISTEIYDGQAWRSGVNLPLTFRCGEAAGDVGSELLFGGQISGSHSPSIAGIKNGTLRGDGTSFSQDALMNVAQADGPAVKGGNIGVQNSALSVQLTMPSTAASCQATEEYDGMTWKIHPSNAHKCAGNQSTGTVTAAIVVGGHARGACTEFFDGTSWASGPALSRGKCGGAMGGTQNDAMTIGGNTNSPYERESEIFNGTVWTSTNQTGGGLGVRGAGNGGGSANSISHGGHSSSAKACVWDIYYPLSASFGRVEPKHGIITDRFELEGKHIDDNNTVFLLHSNTVNDSVAFSGSMGDSSLSNHSMSFSGSVKHTSSFAQFGRTSIYFSGDGSLEVSGSGTVNRDLEFGNDDFTIEYWVRQDAVQAAKTIFRKPGSYVLENETDVNNITFKFNESASISVGSNYTSSVDLWNHVAVVRHEDTLNMYVNGKLRDTRADMTESMGSYGNSLFLGDADLREGTDTAFSGYIDEFRISNIARYNTEFVPEEGEIERIASGSSPDAPFSAKKYEPVTFKLPQFTNHDQPAILTQTLFQTNFSSSLSAISGSRTGRSGSGLYIKEENVGTVAGDMWFNRENNSLNFTFESSSYSGGAWSAGGDILTPYDNRGGGTGVPDAAVSFNAGGGAATSSINYDGAAWSLSGTMILARTTVGAAGTSQNAALAIGGYASPFDPGMCTETEAYDGMTWTEVADVITGRKHADGAGSQNAALFIGGYDVAAGALSNKTEHFNGSAWSAGGALIIARQSHAAAGQQYAALAIGGGVPAVSTTVEEYNGSVWSAATAKITALGEGAGDGGVGSAIMAGSGTSPRGQTEEYNGVSWKAGPVLITGRQDLESASVGFASTGKGLVFGGRTPGATRATEEYTYSGVKSTLVVCALTGSQA